MGIKCVPFYSIECDICGAPWHDYEDWAFPSMEEVYNYCASDRDIETDEWRWLVTSKYDICPHCVKTLKSNPELIKILEKKKRAKKEELAALRALKNAGRLTPEQEEELKRLEEGEEDGC